MFSRRSVFLRVCACGEVFPWGERAEARRRWWTDGGVQDSQAEPGVGEGDTGECPEQEAQSITKQAVAEEQHRHETQWGNQGQFRTEQSSYIMPLMQLEDGEVGFRLDVPAKFSPDPGLLRDRLHWTLKTQPLAYLLFDVNIFPSKGLGVMWSKSVPQTDFFPVHF